MTWAGSQTTWKHGSFAHSPLPEACLFAALILTIGCGTRVSDPSPTTTDGSAGLIHLLDGGYHPIDFACRDAEPGTDLSDAEATEASPATCSPVDPSVRFSVDVVPILGSCSGELCHDAWKYATTVGIASQECCDRRKLIDPGRPDQSYLLQKLGGTNLCGNSSEMPPGVNVPRRVLDVVESWICLGAPDN
jgi:hypothetical protein